MFRTAIPQITTTRRSFLLGLSATAVIAPTLLSTDAFAASPIRAFVPKGSGNFDHSAFDALLKTYVKPDSAGYNRVDYKGLQSQATTLKTYIASLEAASPSKMGADAAHAFWINTYNAKTLDVILDHFPVKSIKDIKLGGGGLFGSGPWSADILTVEGTALSLDDVEHRIVRAIFNDPMSHYGLNCASYSCPNLMPTAYTASNLNALLDTSGSQYINHPRGVSVENGRVQASKIYSWYGDDWGGKDAVRAHWLKYANPDLTAALAGAASVRYNYDWSLNIA